MTRVCILGSGWSAAFANRACQELDILPDVFSSTLPMEHPALGAFWVQWLPESLRSLFDPVFIDYKLLGSYRIYFANFWGIAYDPGGLLTKDPVGEGSHFGWNPYQVWPYLWRTGMPQIRTFSSDKEIAELAKEYDLVLQTFPTFASRAAMSQYSKLLWIRSFWAPKRHSNEVVYLGKRLGAKIVRVSWLFDMFSLESSQPVGRHTWQKVPKLNPCCIPDLRSPAPNVMMIGRYAQWDPRKSAHASYSETYCKLLGRVNKSTRSSSSVSIPELPTSSSKT